MITRDDAMWACWSGGLLATLLLVFSGVFRRLLG
jgi:hypothetical protein